jgi:hypothetical protein
VTAAPVVIFAYNRPRHLERALETLASAALAKETPVYVFADGPKSDQAAVRVAEVRAVIERPEWASRFADFTVVASSANKGLAQSIISGVTRVLADHDRAIVLEDDLLVSADFLTFMNDSLAFYRDDREVGSVAGYCPPGVVPPGYDADVMAVPRGCSHGWATWADRWRSIDWSRDAALAFWREPGLRRRLDATGSDQANRLRRQLNGEIETWAILFNLWQVHEGRHTIYPTRNRIENIGFDDSGVNTGAIDDARFRRAVTASPYRLTRPDISPVIVAAFHRLYSGSLPGRIKRRLLNLRGPRASG